MEDKSINAGKVGLTMGGDWKSSESYEKLTCVSHNGRSWAAKKNVSAGVEPSEANSAFWQLMSDRGVQGIQGPVGPQGNSAFDGTGVEIVNNLTQGGESAVLSAEQGKVLKTELTELESELEKNIANQNNEIADFKETITDQVNNYKPIVINGNVTNAADEEDITSEDNLLKLKDRSALNGMGYVILRKNKSLAEQINKENTIYEIRYDYDLGGNDVLIPKNTSLFFNGGSLRNGAIICDQSYIETREASIFKKILMFGTLQNVNLPVEWFGVSVNDEVGDDNRDGLYYACSSAINTKTDVLFSQIGVYHIRGAMPFDDIRNNRDFLDFCGISITGVGHGTIIKGMPIDSHNNPADVFNFYKCKNVNLQELSVTAIKADNVPLSGEESYYGTNGVDFICSTNVSVRNVKVFNLPIYYNTRDNYPDGGKAFTYQEGDTPNNNISVCECIAEKCAIGLDITSSDENEKHRISFMKNRISDCFIGFWGQYFSNKFDVVVSNNHIIDCQYGFGIYAISNAQLINNKIVTRQFEDEELKSSLIFPKEVWGIWITQANNCIISGNYVELKRGKGYYKLQRYSYAEDINSDNVSVINNMGIGHVTGYAFYLDNSAEDADYSINNVTHRNCTIKDNLFFGAELGDYFGSPKDLINGNNEFEGMLNSRWVAIKRSKSVTGLANIAANFNNQKFYFWSTTHSDISFDDTKNKVYFNNVNGSILICQSNNIASLGRYILELHYENFSAGMLRVSSAGEQLSQDILYSDKSENNTIRCMVKLQNNGDVRLMGLNGCTITITDIAFYPMNQHYDKDASLSFDGDIFLDCAIHNTPKKSEIPYNKLYKDREGNLKVQDANTVGYLPKVGSSEEKPTNLDALFLGYNYFDTTIQQEIYVGEQKDTHIRVWVDRNGNYPYFPKKGTFAERPQHSTLCILTEGFTYYCTDRKATEANDMGILLYYIGNGVWADAFGRIVA